jgi:hypothetical protein
MQFQARNKCADVAPSTTRRSQNPPGDPYPVPEGSMYRGLFKSIFNVVEISPPRPFSPTNAWRLTSPYNI